MSQLDQIFIGLSVASFFFCLRVVQEGLSKVGLLKRTISHFELARLRCEKEEVSVREEMCSLIAVREEAERALAAAADTERTLVRKIVVS